MQMKLPLTPVEVEDAHREAEDACAPSEATSSNKKDDEFSMDLPEFYLALVLCAEKIFKDQDQVLAIRIQVAGALQCVV